MPVRQVRPGCFKGGPGPTFKTFCGEGGRARAGRQLAAVKANQSRRRRRRK